MIATQAQKKHNRDFLNKCIKNIPSSMPNLLPSEHAESRRVLPPNTPRPGKYDLSITEYFREIINNFAPWSPIQQTTLMKPSQFGATTLAESIIVYYMDHAPADIGYYTAKGDSVKKWVNRLEHAITSYGIRELFVSDVGPKKGRSSADKSIQKNYNGCQANFGSLRSIADMSSETKRLVIRDEASNAPLLIPGYGSPMVISYQRTNAWGKRRKVFDTSTAGTSGQCAIEIEFYKGDQRYFWMPCPKCGTFQLLEFDHLWRPKDKPHADTSYICCGPKECELKNYHKSEMIPNGYWKPTAKNEIHRSYQINALYTFVGGRDWNECHDLMLAAEKSDNPLDMREFDIFTRAIPYKETGTRPKIPINNPLRTRRKSGELHDDIIFLTAAVDVQDGFKDPKLKKPRRLELNVMGHGTRHRSWHIEHQVFTGEIATPDGEAWQKLFDWHNNLTDNPYRKKPDGRPFLPMFIFLDCGSGKHIQVVYDVAATHRNYFPSMGFETVSSKKLGNEIDEATAKNYERYRAVNVGPGIIRYNIATNIYRTTLYTYIAKTIQHVKKPDADQQYGYIGFPVDYSDDMFRQLTAADMLTNGTFDKRGRPAEQFDLFVYNLCCGDVFIEKRVIERRAKLLQNKQVIQAKIKNYTTQFALLEMIFENGDATLEEEKQYVATMADFMVM